MAKKIVIVGGGTSGWMAALLIQKQLGDQVAVQLIESTALPTIGVGEGSTPALKAFFDMVDIAETAWMPSCSATYKLGIFFDGWSDSPGFESYFHAFYTHFDRDYVKGLIHNSILRRNGLDVHAHPNAFCYAHTLAKMRLSPVTPPNFPFQVNYGYHFDAGLLGNFLKKTALARQVQYADAEIVEIKRAENGDIVYLTDKAGHQYDGDMFIDCTGFARRLIAQPLMSYGDVLLNDRAVTVATEKRDEPVPATLSIAMNSGWAWDIPLQDRTGHGYVYSSRFCDSETAEKELLAHIGSESVLSEPRHLRFETGRLYKHWIGNCVAIGLSQGFVEPLEAAGLALTQMSILRFVEAYKSGGFGPLHAEAFNTQINASFDATRDYISMHYLLSRGRDTPYWQYSQLNKDALSPPIKAVMAAWFGGEDIKDCLDRVEPTKAYSVNSWYYILCGMGIFPPQSELKSPQPQDIVRVNISEFDTFFAACALNHEKQSVALKHFSKI
ncbi:MAG: tryptophan halogenase family protein [Asticcacaulis sp.]